MIKIYNTLHNQKEEFVPRQKGKVGMYVCGPTTYNYIHLGNARPIVVFDTVRRYLKYRGFAVTYVQNFTDIDDKIINRAKEEGLSAKEVAEKYIAAYFADTAALNVLQADVHPKVTEHIDDIIDMVKHLVENGHAYAASGDVYYDVRSFADYGQLSGRSLDEMMAGARVEVGDIKKDPLDFALWKAAKEGEPAWKSPWGMGRPGWHIECSAMSRRYLGESFDIHGGGADLIFPHHENEIAQSQGCCGGGTFAKYWMHNGFITVNSEKMSKSLGNFFLLRDILDQFPGDVIRFYLLSTHYRSPLDFDDAKLQVAAKSLERIRNSYQLLQEAAKTAIAEDADFDAGMKSNQMRDIIDLVRADFIAAMDDDFNTALAFAAIYKFCHELNSYLSLVKPAKKVVITAAQELFDEFDQVLGMIKPYAAAKEEKEIGIADELLQMMIEMREEARKKKDWAQADAIRDKLKGLGIALEDTPQGVRWKKI